jgi:prepilin-type N-terminal cleavage/methylation domain-containing protein
MSAMTVITPRSSGFTLIEILIAITLISLLSVAMLFAIRIGLNSELKASAKLMANRRVVGAQRALEQELNGFMPEVAVWSDPSSGGRQNVPFFQGDEGSMRFVSSYSLNDASRGQPQLLAYAVIPGDRGEGVRLIVNEVPYRGGASAGSFISGFEQDSHGVAHPRFFPIQPGPNSFVIADRLAYCHLLYLEQEQNPPRQDWRQDWVARAWPLAVRADIAPLQPDPALLHPVSITAPLHARRDPDKKYTDEPGFPE